MIEDVEEEIVAKQKRFNAFIILVSIAIPLVVGVLIFLPNKLSLPAELVQLLPKFNAGINSLTSLFLVIALIAIKRGNRSLHRTLMLSNFLLGAAFLVSYVLYHSSAPSTVFGDLNGDGVLSLEENAQLGISRSVYLFVLLTHILLAIVVVPLVLVSLNYALVKRFDKHKRIVRYAYPVWLYVSITGVVVYFMISPYYTF